MGNNHSESYDGPSSHLRTAAIFCTFLVITLLVYAAKLPMAYKNLYAEDGAIFYQDAVDASVFGAILEPSGGYLILVSRLVGQVVALSPVTNVPIANFFTVCMVIALICVVIWRNLRAFVSSSHLRMLCTLSIILLPILNFELMASSSSLHFLLLFPALLIIINFRQEIAPSRLDIIVLVLAFLSDPLSIFLLIALVRPARINIRDALTNWRELALVDRIIYLTILFCAVVQCSYAAYSILMGHRRVSSGGSLLKTIYLYLDRVVGASLIPNWGFVSSRDFVTGIISTNLLLRAGAALIAVSVLVWTLFHLWKKANNSSQNSSDTFNRIELLLGISGLYWAVVGYLFNPEPRYAIFPGLCLVTTVLMATDFFIISTNKSQIIGKYFGLAFASALIISTWLFSITPSPLRTDGPTWDNQLLAAREGCKSEQRGIVKIQVLPLNANWFVEIKCSDLVGNTVP